MMQVTIELDYKFLRRSDITEITAPTRLGHGGDGAWYWYWWRRATEVIVIIKYLQGEENL